MKNLRQYLFNKPRKDYSVMEKIWEYPYIDLGKWNVWWKIEVLRSKIGWEILVNIRYDTKKIRKKFNN